MAVSLVPPGPGSNAQQVLQALYDAVSELQNPGSPLVLASVDLKTDLARDGYLPAQWPNGYILCAEINSVVASTLVAGAWTWLRSDGSAL